MATTAPTPGQGHGRAASAQAATSAATRLRPVLDPLLVATLTAFTVATLPVIDDTAAAYREVGPAAFLLVGVAAAATLVRARWPVLSALIAATAISTYLTLSYPYGPVFGFIVLTVYTVARRRPLRVSVGAAVATLVLLLIHIPVNDASLPGPVAVVPAFAWVAIPFTVGAARRLVVDAERRERIAADQQLVDAERLRLSQEVHDVVGHGLAAIQMQADVTLHVHASQPDRMRAALETISHASQDALDELHATLASIRDGGDGRLVDHAPTPGLARIPELCRRVEEAGIKVDLTIDGEPRPLPPAADVAAYRVLQEALTNVVKHSAHQHADVRIRHGARVVTLEVTNQNLGPAPTEGIGISGMRRRIVQVGGTFRAGPGPQTGTFQIRAVIPRKREESGR